MNSPQVGAALAIIKRSGGRISHVDFLEAMGMDALDPRGENLIKKVVHRTRHTLFRNEGGFLTLTRSLDEVPSDELQTALSELIGSFRRVLKNSEKAEKFYGENRFVWGVILGLVIGFIVAFFVVSTPVNFDASELPICLTSEN